MNGFVFNKIHNGPFLDNDSSNPMPPWSSVRELQHAVEVLENSENIDIKQLLEILVAPGPSLDGASPEANITDENGNLSIVKFPSKNDTVDRAAWECLAYRLAIEARINMSPCKIEKLKSTHHTFLTKRFDREGNTMPLPNYISRALLSMSMLNRFSQLKDLGHLSTTIAKVFLQ